VVETHEAQEEDNAEVAKSKEETPNSSNEPPAEI
jgi:hypothetical protein